MIDKLRPAVEVGYECWGSAENHDPDAVSAIIEADREAVRAEQAAELAKWKALAETLAGALEQFDQGCAAIGGCSDGYCVIQRPKGQHTNGGCRCSDDRNRMRRFASRAAYFREKVAQALTSYKEQRDV